MLQVIEVGEEQARQRVDVLACNKLPDLSRAYVQRLIVEGKIKVNGKQEKPGYRVRLGDKLEINYDGDIEQKIEDIDLPVLYQDDQVLIVNKPVGVISHSRGKFWYEPSVASFVRQITGQEGERSGIVHRLDRATSGVMICTKTTDALKVLQKQFSDRTVKKTYRAIIAGKLKEPEAVIDMPIERNPKKPQLFRAGAQGKAATTHYKVLQETKHYSLLELSPATGRTHQLRVHLQAIGHPIVGDELYEGAAAKRLMLHAYSLEITMPGGMRKTFSAEMPEEFTDLLESDS